MESAGYLIIYTKNNSIGHVRYEIGDGRSFKKIRGLSVKYSWQKLSSTIYEQGEYDSHDISVYNTDEYTASEKIPLSHEELIDAMVYTRDNDEMPPEYNFALNNCNDFTTGLLSAAGKKGCVGDYLREEQKQSYKLSQGSDFLKCRIPEKVDEAIEGAVENAKKAKTTTADTAQRVCNGIVSVGSYTRLGHTVQAYTRNCGRH